MTKSGHGFSTRSINSNRQPDSQHGFVNTPVYRGSTVVFPTLDELEHSWSNKATPNEIVYGRRGTPTAFALENAIAELENGHLSLVVSSGLAAITTSILAFVESGGHLLAVDSIYGPARVFCDEVLTKIGVHVEYYDPMIGSGIEDLIRDNTTCIHLESPGSLTFEIQDAPAIAAVAKKHGIATILDNSWATPCYFRPLDHGINVSFMAATKYIVGHSDAMLGLITTDEQHYDPVRRMRDNLGQCAGPDDLFLALRGLRTLPIRLQHHNEQARKLAGWLKSQPGVLSVLHPAFEDCPGHEVWKRDFSGASGLFSFELEQRSRSAVTHFLDNLELFSMGGSWGGFESLIIPAIPGDSRLVRPWTGEGRLFRVHVGLEDIDDLIRDLSAGLDRYRSRD